MSEQVEAEAVEEVENNPELEALLEEARKTKAQEQEEERAADIMTDEKAAEIASAGLMGLVGLVNEFGGLKIVIPEKTAVIAMSLFCPLVKKYGAKIKFNPQGVDLDGWMPELLALGGAGVLGFTINKQLNEKPVKNEVAVNGD